MKRLVSAVICFFMFVTLAAVGVISCCAYDGYVLSELGKCSSIGCDSNETGGYFYGKNDDTVYTARMLPDLSFRYFTVDGAIKSISQSKNLTCVLACVNTSASRYSISVMDCNSESVVSYTFECNGMRDDSFSLTENCVYVLKTDDLYAYVQCINLESGEYVDVKFGDNVNEIFNNNGNSYARLYDGSVYRLSFGEAVYCADAGKYTDISNAGVDLIFTDEECLISLADGSGEFYIGAQRGHIAESGGCVYYFDGIRLHKVSENEETVIETDGEAPRALVSCGGKCALLTEDCAGLIYSDDDFEADVEDESIQASEAKATEVNDTESTKKSSSVTTAVKSTSSDVSKTAKSAATDANKSTTTVEAQTSSKAAITSKTVETDAVVQTTESAEQTTQSSSDVSESSQYIYADGIIKNITASDTVKNFKTVTSASAVYKSDGVEVKSGKLKTGYQTVIDSQSWLLAVRGDVTGEGNVNSRDIKLVMQYLCGSAQLDGVYAAAADYNLDSLIDCRDLTLIAKQWKSG